jgi:hypothetical protein
MEDALAKMGLTVEEKPKAERPKSKGRPVKKKVETVDNGHAVEFDDKAKISNLGPVQPPTLANTMFDPFEKYKTDQNRYHYRALQVNPQNLSRKQAAGYEIVRDEEKGESVQFGDLVLGRMDKGLYDARTAKDLEKAKRAVKGVKKTTEHQLHEQGFKTFEPD